MTIQASAGMPAIWAPGKVPWVEGNSIPQASDSTVDAAGEYVHMTGYCYLEGRTGTKTISSAGGKIHFLVGAATITFSNAGTNLRVGIQDTSTSAGPPARGDGTFDVYDDLVGGTDTLTALTQKTATMSSGTKDITHGQLISVVIGMTSRGGTDSMKVRNVRGVDNLGAEIPNVVLETSGPTFTGQASVPNVVIEFDDGTFGFLFGTWHTSTGAVVTSVAFNSSSTPDEYLNVIEFPYPVDVLGLSVLIVPSAAAADFELILYSDPLGTPAVIETVSVSAENNLATSTARTCAVLLSTVRSLSANTQYGVAIRPTAATNVTIYTHDVGAAAHWRGHDLGENCYLATRSNQTGAFSATTTRRVLGLSVCLAAFGDDAGGGGGGSFGRMIGA